jgi:hypothetical protein
MKSTCFAFNPEMNPYRLIVVASSISNRYNTKTLPIMEPGKCNEKLT